MHNPGMSEKAWISFNKLIAKFNLKYATQIVKQENLNKEMAYENRNFNENGNSSTSVA